MSTVDEIRNATRKIVKLPSGFTVTIRKLWQLDLLGVGELPIPTSGDESKTNEQNLGERFEAVEKLCARVVAKGAIEPRFTDRDDNRNSPDMLHVSELPSDEDFNVLAGEILNFSGLGRDQAEQAEAFRSNGEREISARDGAGLPGPTERDPKDNAGRVLPESGNSLSGEPEKEKTDPGA